MKLSGTRRIQTFRKASGAAIVVVLASTVAITTVWFLCA